MQPNKTVEIVPVAANAEAWLYARLAEVAGSGKLTREKVKAERSELLEHPLTKMLLKTRPLPTGEELYALSRGAKDATKYLVKIVPGDWSGPQRLGSAVDDVMRFQLSDELLDEIVSVVPVERREDFAETVLSYVDESNGHRPPADERTLGWVRFFLQDPYVVVEELQTDVPLLRAVMGEPLHAVDWDDLPYPGTERGARDPRGLRDAEIGISDSIEQLQYAEARPFLAMAAEQLGLDPPPGAGTYGGRDPRRINPPTVTVMQLTPDGQPLRLGRVVEIHGTSFNPYFIQKWDSGLGRSIIRPFKAMPNGPSDPNRMPVFSNAAQAWAQYLAEQARQLAGYAAPEQLWEGSAGEWVLGDYWTPRVIEQLNETERQLGETGWSLTRIVAVDVHNQLVAMAQQYLRHAVAERRAPWRHFVVQLHDLYETMLAFVLDWAAGRTRTIGGAPAGAPFEVEAVLIPTHKTKLTLEAGGGPVFPYSKLYRRFQSAPIVPLVGKVDLTGSSRPEYAEARALIPNDPSIWYEP